MSSDHVPYLDILRAQFGPAIVARDANSRLIPEYSRRLLNLLVQRERVLPRLQADALQRIEPLLDELMAEVQGIEGGLILVPQLIKTIRVDRDYARAEPFVQSAVRLLGTCSTPRARRLEAEIARIGFDLSQAFTKAVSDTESAADGSATAPPEPLTAAQKSALQAWLRETFDEPDVAIGAIEAVIGGGSKLTLIVTLLHAQRLPAEIVARIDRAGGIVTSAVVDEYRLIEAAHRAGVRVPQPLGLDTSGKVLGAPFVVMSRVRGRNIGDWMEVHEPTRAFAVGLAETLARLHRMPVEDAGGRLAGARTTIRERVAHELDFYERSWRASGEPSIMIEQALAWCRRHLDQSEGRRVVVHGDVGLHNMLGFDGELSALLDWETAVVGNPAQDLLYVQHTVEPMMPWEEFLAEYVRAGGVALTDAETEFYRVLIGIFRMHFMFLARAYVSSGFSNSVIHAYAGNRVSLHAERRLYEAVSEALAREAAAP